MNIVYNKLVVAPIDQDERGELMLDQLEDLLWAKGGVTFEKLAPMPEFQPDINDWCKKNWGTVTDAFEGEQYLATYKWEVTYLFQTNNTAALPVIQKLFKQFPNCHIQYTAASYKGDVALHMYRTYKGKKGDCNEAKAGSSKKDFSKNTDMRKALYQALRY